MCRRPTDSETVAGKTQVIYFLFFFFFPVHHRLRPTSCGDCQVTFRHPPPPFFNLFAMLKLHSSPLPLLRPSPPPRLSFLYTAEKQVHCDSECSSTPRWLLFEMRFERVSRRERDRERQEEDREARAAEPLDE